MSSISSGFHPARRDRLLQENARDAYKAKGKLAGQTVCPQCHAVFEKGRWQWAEVAEDPPHSALCPGCQRINDDFPAGYVSLKGAFFHAHRSEIIKLVHHHALHVLHNHPLQKIIRIEKDEHGAQVLTTDIHLARGIGEALHDAYQGSLAYHYNDGGSLLRVVWAR